MSADSGVERLRPSSGGEEEEGPCRAFRRPLNRHCQRLFHLLLVFHALDLCGAVRQSHYIHWNTSNPIFRIDNTDHIIDVNRGNQPWEYDQVNIICPLYRPEEASKAEKYVIYSVSKEEYESCRIMSTNPRVIAQCTRPHELMYFTLTFRSFTPTPGGMEFKPGRDYYFISTSSHRDVDRRVGGRCSTHNMKVQFKVADNNHEGPPSHAVNRPRHRHNNNSRRNKRPLPEPSTTTTTTSTTTFVSPTTTERRSNKNPYVYEKLPRFYGDLSYYPLDDYEAAAEAARSGGDYSDNEVVKHEASRMAASSAVAALRRGGEAAAVLLIAAALQKIF